MVFAALVFCPFVLRADIIMLEDFEDGTVNYTGVTEFHDSANDYFGRVPALGAIAPDDGPYTGFGGTNYFAAEDINSTMIGGGGPGLATQTLEFTINIAGHESLKFSGLFAAGGNDAGNSDGFRYDDEDGLRVTAQIDGGGVQNLLAFEAAEPGGDLGNNELLIDANFDGIGDPAGFQPTESFTAFNDIGITGTGTELLLKIEVTATAQSEAFAFDNVQVSGMKVVPEPSSFILAGLTALMFSRRRRVGAANA